MPMLTLALQLPIHIAIGSSLIAIVATSCTAASTYIKARLTNIKLGMLWETVTIPGAIIGASVAATLSSSILSAILGIILIYTAYRMVRQQFSKNEDVSSEDDIANPDKPPTNPPSWLLNSYYDQNLDKVITYKINHMPHGLGAGFFGGVLSGLVGIGGGIINVPVMNLIMGLPMKAAIGTSSFIIAITATAGALIYYYHGYIYPILVAPLVIGVFLGARAGSELTQRARGTLLRHIFAAFLFVMSILMFLQTANINLAI